MGSYFSVENNTNDIYWIQHAPSETGMVFAVIGTVVAGVIATIATAGAAGGAAAAGVLAVSTAVTVVSVTAECMIAGPYLIGELDEGFRDKGFSTIDPNTTYKSKKMTLSLVRTAYLCKSHTSPLLYDAEIGDYYQTVTISSAKRDVWTGASDGSTMRYKVSDWDDWEVDHTYEIRFTPDSLTDAQMEYAKIYADYVDSVQDGDITAIIKAINALAIAAQELQAQSRGLPGEEDEEEVVPPPQPLCFKKDEKFHIVFGKEGSTRLLKRYQNYQQQKKTRGKRDEMEDAMAHGYSFKIEKMEGDKKEEEGKVVEKKNGHPPKIRRAYYKFEK